MSLENAVYTFLDKEVRAASNSAAIGNAIVHADEYEEIKDGTKWIRVGDLYESEPSPKIQGISESNGFIEIHFIAKPETQSKENRRTARKIASDMANEITDLIFNNSDLNDTTGEICDCLPMKKRNEYRNIGTVRHAASFLLLKLNSR